MFEVVLIVGKRLRGVEWWINVDALDLTDVFVRQLGHLGQRFEYVTGFAEDEQVVLGGFQVSTLRVRHPLFLRGLLTTNYALSDQGVDLTVAGILRVDPGVAVL